MKTDIWKMSSKVGSGDCMFDSLRQKMVEEQIVSRGVTDKRILAAMRHVPRHLFVPAGRRSMAYWDGAFPIGYGQTISQPFIVAFMTEAARVGPGSRVLEIGTGSGYQTAVLSEIVREVYSIEFIPELAAQAIERLQKLGYKNAKVKRGDGYKGWPEHAFFDAILVTAAPPEVPKELLKQMRVGGCMLVPVGEFNQELKRITRTQTGFEEENLFPVVFVPMIPEKEKPPHEA